MPLVVLVFHWAAVINAFVIIKVEVGVTGKALVLRGAVASFAVREATLANGSVGPKSDWTLSHAECILR